MYFFSNVQRQAKLF